MLKLLHEVGRSVAVLDNDALLLVYRYGAGWPKPHFHPLYAPGSSRIISLHAPHDWAHHRGLMWSWGRVAPQERQNDDGAVNFWEERRRETDAEGRVTWPQLLDPAVRGVIRHTGFRSLLPGRSQAVLQADHAWCRADSDIPLLHSQMDATVYPARAEGWFFDLRYTLQAANAPMVLLPPDAPSLYPIAPYGLACQLARDLCNGALLNSAGQTGAASSQPARWCDYAGIADDDESEGATHWLGLTLMDHPANPRHPTPFATLGGGAPFLAASPLGDRALPIAADAATTWRYRVWIHHGRNQAATLEEIYSQFVRDNP